MPSIKDADKSNLHLYTEESLMQQNHSSLSNVATDQPNFPLSQMQARAVNLRATEPLTDNKLVQRFATIATSDASSILEKRSQNPTSLARHGQAQRLKKVDYSDISMAMIQ